MIQSILYGKLPNTRSLLEKLLTVFSGVYLVLFTHTMAVLFRRGIARTGMHRVMILTAIVMWVIATGVCNPRLSYAAKPAADPCCHI
jgi:multisubunit Na+/H+ antiporter MnhC subunit